MDPFECSQPASKSSWDSQDFVDIRIVLKMAYFRISIGPRWVKHGEITKNNKNDRTVGPSVNNGLCESDPFLLATRDAEILSVAYVLNLTWRGFAESV